AEGRIRGEAAPGSGVRGQSVRAPQLLLPAPRGLGPRLQRVPDPPPRHRSPLAVGARLAREGISRAYAARSNSEPPAHVRGVAGKVVRFGEIKEEAGPQARPGDIRQSGPPFQRKHARYRVAR